MPGYRFFAFLAGVTKRITMSPSVMPIYDVGRLCTGVFVLAGNDGSEFGDILECFDQLDLTSCESRSEGAVGGQKGGESGGVAESGGSKVGDGVDGFLLVELRCSLFL